ncbi:MAG: hypothetical protein CMH66_01655 [Nioella sp.]|nr:hypothetical protein [Nioella sp.]
MSAPINEPTDQVVAEYGLYRDLYDSRPVRFAGCTALEPLVAEMKRRMDAEQPFSMARLGDGEGACLFYGHPGMDSLAEYIIHRSLILHFSWQRYSEKDFSFFNAEMRRATLTADLVTFARKPQVHRDLVNSENSDIRGYVGATYADHFVSDLSGSKDRMLYADGYLHVAMLPHYADLLRGRKVVTLGSAPDAFIEKLAGHFSFELLESIRIPGQAVNQKGRLDSYLYPDHLDSVRSRVQHLAKPGIVFVMAAGLATKFLCSDVRARGGFALDVGSVMDVWQGKGARPYQGDTFVARHRLT